MKKYILGIVLAMVMLNACTKKVDPIDISYADIALVNAGTGFVTTDVTVNPKDSIFFSFTIRSSTA